MLFFPFSLDQQRVLNELSRENQHLQLNFRNIRLRGIEETHTKKFFF